jgi:hypothetical protein
MDFYKKCESIGGYADIFRDAEYCYIPLDLMDDIFGKNACKTMFNGFVLKKEGVCSIQKYQLDRTDISLDNKYRLLQSAAKRYIPKAKPIKCEQPYINYIPGKPFFYEGELDVDGNPCYHINIEGSQWALFIETCCDLAKNPNISVIRKNKEDSDTKQRIFSDEKGNIVMITLYYHYKDVPRIKIIVKKQVDDNVLLKQIKKEFMHVATLPWQRKRKMGVMEY